MPRATAKWRSGCYGTMLTLIHIQQLMLINEKFEDVVRRVVLKVNKWIWKLVVLEKLRASVWTIMHEALLTKDTRYVIQDIQELIARAWNLNFISIPRKANLNLDILAKIGCLDGHNSEEITLLLFFFPFVIIYLYSFSASGFVTDVFHYWGTFNSQRNRRRKNLEA
ncbi:hypothetical protein RJT34_25811 [Clitoria ternatea]|uniref:Uncharacterized protein n=1 Tax=Clitoria ternatea TaxID=43366 RepID=A0AAN9FT25_CLITE